MITMLTTSDIPTVDPDFDDLEMFQPDLLDDDTELASPEEQELYDFWDSIDAELALDRLENGK